jgi:predicted N-formylglutamate amidohydrolase
VHAERRCLPHLLIELRPDLIAEPAGQGVLIERLASLLKTAPRFQP